MADSLAQTLLQLTELGRPLAETQQLEDFQRLAIETCSGASLTQQHLARARTELQDAGEATWDELAASGVVLADAVR